MKCPNAIVFRNFFIFRIICRVFSVAAASAAASALTAAAAAAWRWACTAAVPVKEVVQAAEKACSFSATSVASASASAVAAAGVSGIFSLDSLFSASFGATACGGRGVLKCGFVVKAAARAVSFVIHLYYRSFLCICGENDIIISTQTGFYSVKSQNPSIIYKRGQKPSH